MSTPNESSSTSELKSVKASKSTIDSLLTLNSMTYKLPREMGVSNRRTIIANGSHRSSYSETDRILLHLNSGSRYLYGKNCWLSFNLKTQDPAGAISTDVNPFGSDRGGSVTDIIRDITITSASGTVISKTQGVNVLARQLQRWTCDRDYSKRIGEAWGQVDYDANALNIDHAFGGTQHVLTTGTVAGGQRFCIPMSLLSPVFAQEKMIPNFLASGMRIEITLESNDRAYNSDSGDDNRMLVEDVEIYLDTFELADPIQKALLRQASGKGLDFWFTEADRTTASIPDTTNKFNVLVRKSASRVLSAIGVTQQTDHANDKDEDSIGTRAWNYSSYKFSLGANQYPQAGTKATQVNNYMNAHYSVDQLAHCCSQPNGVSLNDFATKGYGIVGANLELSAIVQNDGEPTGVGRTLQFEGDITTLTGGNTLHLYIFFLKLCKIHINNVVVKE